MLTSASWETKGREWPDCKYYIVHVNGFIVVLKYS